MRDVGHRREEVDRLVDLHLQHVADALAAPAHRQRLGVEALAVADVARHLHVGQEAHLDRPHALPFAARAAALAGVEARSAPARSRAPSPRASRRTACGSCPRSRCRSPGTSAASCRSASGRPRARGRSSRQPSIFSQPCQLGRAPRVLMNCRLASSTSRASVDLPEPLTPVTATRRLSGMSTVTLLQVVQRRAADRQQRVAALSLRSVAAVGVAPAGAAAADGPAAARGSGRSPNRACDASSVDAAFGDQPAAALAGARADVDDVVGAADRVLVVLDDDQRVALVAELAAAR